MAEHYAQGHRDAFGRRISDEVWDKNERMKAASRQETARRQAEDAASSMLANIIGAIGSTAIGAPCG